MVYLSRAIFMANFQLLTALVISKPGDALNELVWGYSYGVTTLLVEWHTICTTLVFTSHIQTVILCGKAQLVGTVGRPRFDSYLFPGLPTPFSPM